MVDFKRKDANLYQWMEDAAEKGEKVIYVSIGTECMWDRWSIDAVYAAL